MSTTSPAVETLLRGLRLGYRLPLLLLHLLIGLPITLVLIALGRGGRLSHAAIRFWAGGLTRVFGLRVRREGTPLPGGILFVANHVSWMDIVVLHSQRMMGFIAKSEIRGWPLIGWLAAQGESIFLQRGNGDSLGQVVAEMAQRLRAGRAIGVFPEGGTRSGKGEIVFHARIFAAAVEAQATVQPVAVAYGPKASAQAVMAFAPRERFLGNFFRVLGEPARTVRVGFLEPIPPEQFDGRRGIADMAQARVSAAMTAD
ncbi:lysophospholipid acyltransferase family protein [Thermomonas sp.]|uniref:lysophospholipid acyltransferase family protein n=1 Tax=Thermomonas sp. TaxID=1971895 RepID=UPI0026270840|nr:lysophospholipid acyltransferase family protein [Thermomonas sp.]